MAIDGRYYITIHTAIGDQQNKLTIQTTGNVLTGVSENSMSGTTRLENGKINGNELTWTQNSKMPMGTLKLEFRCTVDGNKISGKATSVYGTTLVEGTKQPS
jgi:hypothetical protein